MTEVRAVKIAGLQTDRPWPDDEGIDALAADIRRHGVKEPILVIGREEYVLDGVRRVAAMRKLGRENIPAFVSDDMFDVAIHMYETQPQGLTARRRVEIIRHVHALMGKRPAQAIAADRLEAYLKATNKQKEVTTILRQSGTVRTLLALAAQATPPFTRIQFLPPVIRAADLGDTFAQELLRRFEGGELTLTVMNNLWKERNGRPGDITKAAEQSEILTKASLSLASAVYALQKLGPIHPSITGKELDGFIKNLYDPRTDLTVVINKLRKELKDRYEQDS